MRENICQKRNRIRLPGGCLRRNSGRNAADSDSECRVALSRNLFIRNRHRLKAVSERIAGNIRRFPLGQQDDSGFLWNMLFRNIPCAGVVIIVIIKEDNVHVAVVEPVLCEVFRNRIGGDVLLKSFAVVFHCQHGGRSVFVRLGTCLSDNHILVVIDGKLYVIHIAPVGKQVGDAVGAVNIFHMALDGVLHVVQFSFIHEIVHSIQASDAVAEDSNHHRGEHCDTQNDFFLFCH